jgi:hypothetical protein
VVGRRGSRGGGGGTLFGLDPATSIHAQVNTGVSREGVSSGRRTHFQLPPQTPRSIATTRRTLATQGCTRCSGTACVIDLG